jgi:hypothetical protein
MKWDDSDKVKPRCIFFVGTITLLIIAMFNNHKKNINIIINNNINNNDRAESNKRLVVFKSNSSYKLLNPLIICLLFIAIIISVFLPDNPGKVYLAGIPFYILNHDNTSPINIPQQIFTLFFVIYFSITAQNAGKFQGFNTPAMMNGNIKAWRRFWVSLLLINILPIIYFIYIFNLFESRNLFGINILSMILLLSTSLVGLGFYRVYYGIMIVKSNNGDFYFYDDGKIPHKVREEWDEEYKGENYRTDPYFHIRPGLIWILISVIAGRILVWQWLITKGWF